MLALMSKSSVDALRPIRALLTAEFPGKIYFLDQGQLHITITAVIRDITYGDHTRDEFLSQKDIIVSSIDKIVKNYSRFSIHVNQIKATPDALIVESPDVDTLNKLRTDIISELSIIYPSATIAHSSVARFRGEIPLDTLNKALESINVDFTEHIEELVLVRETVMPLEKYEIIERFSLS